MSAVLVDIGGTHVRFAMLGQDGPEKAEKFPVADYADLSAALARYGAAKGALHIATAAWPYPDGTWRFAREGRWVISVAELEKSGWRVGYIGNDFGAGARGALTLGDENLHTLQKPGENPVIQKRAAVLGAGTGLGLAYVCDGSVHETYGGQMEIPLRTDEQHMFAKLVLRLKGNRRPVSAEDVISGPGLSLLYKAACIVHGQKVVDIDPAALLANRRAVLESQALRLYHEFLGMFAHQAVIYGHAYAGLYMDGGVLHRLVGEGAFDRARFMEFFIGDPLPLIKDQMKAMPVHIVTDPFVTLKGLAEIVKNDA